MTKLQIVAGVEKVVDKEVINSYGPNVIPGFVINGNLKAAAPGEAQVDFGKAQFIERDICVLRSYYFFMEAAMDNQALTILGRLILLLLRIYGGY